MNDLKALLNASDDSGDKFKKRKCMRVQPDLVVKIHLPDLKLHTAEALSIPHDGGSEQAGLLTYNGFHPLPAFGSG